MSGVYAHAGRMMADCGGIINWNGIDEKAAAAAIGTIRSRMTRRPIAFVDCRFLACTGADDDADVVDDVVDGDDDDADIVTSPSGRRGDEY